MPQQLKFRQAYLNTTMRKFPNIDHFPSQFFVHVKFVDKECERFYRRDVRHTKKFETLSTECTVNSKQCANSIHVN